MLSIKYGKIGGLVVMEINNFYIGFIGLAVFIFAITIMFYIWAFKFDKKYLAKE
ncbi:TPA: hypothetical protein HA335_04555 [Methanocaldococcus jannaschii]|uniref:Uncharacterized protein n=1 Tax=Methanocaldococcus jannaschii TaxID=2190 RepID=A0A832T222_9EURY|nr:hypothetical protein [Methanocaldococcus jannaschii]